MAKKTARRASAKVHPLIVEFDAFLREFRPDYYSGLRPGASARDVAAFEKLVGYQLPDLLRDLFLWRDGANERSEPFEQGASRFISLEEARKEWIMLTEMQENGEWGDDCPQSWCRGWMPFIDISPASYLCVDLHGSFTRKVGQVLERWNKFEDRPIVAPSLDAWLENRLENYRSGRWGYDDTQDWVELKKSKPIRGYPIKKYTQHDKPKFPLPEPRPIVPPEFPGVPVAKQIATAPESAGLTKLDLHNKEIGPAGAAHLARSPHLGQLESLSLMFCKIGDAGLKALAASDAFPKLTQLHVGINGIGLEGVSALCDSPLLGQLTSLDLRDNTAGDAGFVALAKSRHTRRLERLILMLCTGVGATGVVALVRSKSLKELRELDLSNDHLTDEMFDKIAAQAALPKLERLELGGNSLGVRSVLALLRAPKLPAMRDLDLRMFDLSDADVETISKEPALSKWRSITLSGSGPTSNRPGVRSLRAIAGSDHVHQLESLSLSHFEMTTLGMQVLGDSRSLGSLKELCFSEPRGYPSQGFCSLVASQQRSGLTALRWEYDYSLDDAMVKALATSRHVRLTSLSFRGCRASPRLAELLSTSENFRSLTHLKLAFVRLEPDGLARLAGAAVLDNLTHLDLRSTGLVPDVVGPFVEAARWPNLESLTVSASDIRTSGEKLLRQRFGDRLHVEP